MPKNHLFIRLCVDIKETIKSYEDVFEPTESVGININTFTDPDECVDFITDLEDLKAVLTVEEITGQQIMPLIHDIPQIDHIHIVSHSESSNSEWFNQWAKVKHIETTPLANCNASDLDNKQDNHDYDAISFIPIDEDDFDRSLDELEPSFMYTHILKDILLDMKFDEESIKNFAAFCRLGNRWSSKNIEKFEKDYRNKLPIWWYTRLPCIFQMLNAALRELKADVIIKMGFFISDLHNQIKQLHSEQLKRYNAEPFIVYRGQGLSKTDFKKLLNAKGGLMSFNNFLSTSTNEIVSLGFAHAALSGTDKIGVLFKMTINPFISSSPFADIQNSSAFVKEEEILFSMHTVFRIGEIKSIDNDGTIYQVELELTDDDDEQLRTLTKHMEDDGRHDAGWKRLGNLLSKIHQYDMIEELYTELLEQKPSDDDRIYYYEQLADAKLRQGAKEEATEYFVKHYENCKKTRRAKNSSSIASGNGVDFFYSYTGNESRSLVFYRNMSLDDEENVSEENRSLITSHNNNADGANARTTQDSSALFWQKSLETYQRALTQEYPTLATFTNEIAGIFDGIDEDSRALLFNEKLLEIRLQVLPPDHHDLCVNYYNIANIYKNRNEHSKALSLFEKSLQILEKNVPANHPDLAILYSRMGLVYENMGEHPKAFLFQRKALKINQRSLPENHPYLLDSYENMASLYYKTAEYMKAVFFYEKANPEQDSLLASLYFDVGSKYKELEDYPKALLFCKKALKIWEKIPVENGRRLAQSYNFMGSTYFRMAEYTKALHFHEKELAINQEIQPPNYRSLTAAYNNLGSVYFAIENYAQARSFFQLALDTASLVPSFDSSQMEVFQENIALIQGILML